MQSQLTVRIPDDLDAKVFTLAKKLHLKRSDIVRMALEKFLGEFREEKADRPYEKVKNLIGAISSAVSDLGEEHRRHLLKKIKRNA